MLAVCDKELLGKKLSEGNAELDLSSDFFKGKEMPDGEIGDLLRNSWTANIVGKKSVELALKEGIITKEHVKKIKDVVYAISVTL